MCVSMCVSEYVCEYACECVDRRLIFRDWLACVLD